MKRRIIGLLLLLSLLAVLTACGGQNAFDSEAAQSETLAETPPIQSETDSVDDTEAETVPSMSESESDVAFETEAETETETDDGLTADLSLTEALQTLGFRNFEMLKLMMLELYYDRYYVGDIPDDVTIAREMKRLYDDFFATAIDPADEALVTGALISCYQAAVGDKYAIYLNEDEYVDYMQDYDAEYVGVGVYLTYDRLNDTAQVLSVYEDTPAMSAGILPGDFIVAVDDVETKELGYYGLLNSVRGEIGTSVKITVERDGTRISMTMDRKMLAGVSVTYRKLAQDATIGYIKIESFNAKTAEQFKVAVDALTADGVRGLVFDLRNNPGGEVEAIVAVLDYLLPDGDALAHFRYSETSGMETKTYIADDGHALSLPMTVLCNEYTASAGELFTSAMKDYHAATVIGVTTYGKGTAQTLIDCGDGTAYTLSIARYDPPFGENYEGKGVVPDREVPLSEQAANVNIFLRDDAIDNQLQAAVTELYRLAAQE